jgi:hypothetical protein
MAIGSPLALPILLSSGRLTIHQRGTANVLYVLVMHLVDRSRWEADAAHGYHAAGFIVIPGLHNNTTC